MKILITGATGFIGKNLIKKLLQEGHDIHMLVRPSTVIKESDQNIYTYIFDGDVEKLNTFVKKENFDGVIHLASLFLAQHKQEDIPDLITSNITFPTTLIEVAVKNNIPWFINTGTFWQHYENKDYSPVNLYAATKQAFEDIAKYYIETSSINFVTIKLCDTFGPHDTRPKIFNLLSKISKTKEQLDMSPGEQLLDINHVSNIVSGFEKMIDILSKDKMRELTGKSFAIMAEERITLQNLVKLFEKITNTKLNINWGGREYRPREVMIPWENGAPIPGWKPTVSIEEGMTIMLKESDKK